MLSAVVNLNKPAGLTSQEAVTRVRRILGVRKAGHCGTLDPGATGVLLVCLGQATRFADYLQAQPKTYRAVLKLGESTDTQDSEGTVTSRKDLADLSEPALRAAAMSFAGRIEQTPPMFSALKKEGTPLYRLARKGLTVERTSRTVEVYSLEIQDIHLPLVSFSVTCSKGLYVRTLCQDIGDRLGVGGHMQALERTAIGRFSLDCAVSFDRLDSSHLIEPEDALSFLTACHLSPGDTARMRNGQPAQVSQSRFEPQVPNPGSAVRLFSPAGLFLGVGRLMPEGLVRSERLMATETSLQDS